MSYTTPFRGVAGARIREDDEGYDAPPAPRQLAARFPGRCALTGKRIHIGDPIYRTAKGFALVNPDRTHWVSDVIEIGGNTFYRNKAGRCEDAPCCGCCTI